MYIKTTLEYEQPLLLRLSEDISALFDVTYDYKPYFKNSALLDITFHREVMSIVYSKTVWTVYTPTASKYTFTIDLYKSYSEIYKHVVDFCKQYLREHPK